MSGFEPYRLANDCPNCGQKDAEDAWKGARIGSSEWGHYYLCCSDKCGHEFFHSQKHKELEMQKIKQQIEMLQRQLKEVARWKK